EAVAGGAAAGAAVDGELGGAAGGEAEEGVVTQVALVGDIEGGTEALDEAQLLEQRGELVGQVRPLDAVGLAEDAGALVARASAEVAEDAGSHLLGLADVEDGAVLREHAVDAGSALGVLLHGSAERGEVLRGGGPPRGAGLAPLGARHAPHLILV